MLPPTEAALLFRIVVYLAGEKQPSLRGILKFSAMARLTFCLSQLFGRFRSALIDCEHKSSPHLEWHSTMAARPRLFKTDHGK